jgi:formate-dependent nitrite reductase membrane component NrfD
MATTTKAAILNRFEVRPTAQSEWHILILVAFFFGSVGTGLFLVSAFLDFTLGLALALIIIALFMGIPHMVYLGHPMRFWRLFTSWTAIKTSWLTRGMWGWAVFGIFGLLALLASLGWLPWSSGSIPGGTVLGIAGAAAIFGMVYPAFVMGQSPAIALWNNSILPALFLVYGLVDGIDLAAGFIALSGGSDTVKLQLLESFHSPALIVIVIFMWAYLGVMSASRVGAREAVRMITRGELAPIFWGVVIVAGIIIPLAVGIYSSLVGLPIIVTGIAGLLGLVGALYFKYVVLMAGVYSPSI